MKFLRKLPLEEYFWSRTTKEASGCWIWIGSKDLCGYGHLRCKHVRNGYFAHRFAYELLKGDIPTGLSLDHLCRNRACVNPEHLEAVPLKENIMRGTSPCATNAKKTHCVNGHPLEGYNSVPGCTKYGRRRRCRKCKNEANRQYKERKRNNG